MEYDETGEPIGDGTWHREHEGALEVRGRRIATFGAAVKWLQALLLEERDATIQEMRLAAEIANDPYSGDIGDISPDTAIWRDTFSQE